MVTLLFHVKLVWRLSEFAFLCGYFGSRTFYFIFIFREGIIVSKKEGSIFADKKEVFTEENPYAAKLDQLISELHGGKKGRSFILFIPLIIGMIVFIVAFLIFSLPYLTRSSNDIDITLVSLERKYNNAISDSLDDTYINATFTITNNGETGISDVNFLTNIKSGDGVLLYSEILSYSCGYLQYIEPGETKTVTGKILPYYRNNFEDNENYGLLWDSSIDQVNTTIDLKMAQYEDGKTLLYNISWYTRNANSYFWILTLTFSVWIGWIIYCFMTRCPKCRSFNAMRSAGKQEMGRSAGSSVKRRAFTDQYGNKIKDSKGKEMYYEETVYGYNVNYKYYHKCKYCGHIKVSQGSEFEG